MSLSLDEIREFSLMALDQPPAVKKAHEKVFKLVVYITTGYYRCAFQFILENGTIDWGDGNVETVEYNDPYLTNNEHIYDTTSFEPGEVREYTIIISGIMHYANFYSGRAIMSKYDKENVIGKILTPFPNTLRSIGVGFRHFSRLDYIPEGLFAGCNLITGFGSCFNECDSLINIPDNLFYGCSSATNFRECFYNCKNLKTIGNHIFDGCSSANNFYWCFGYSTKIESNVPTLWETYPNANGRYCFTACNKAANYSDIPSSWR